MEKKFILLVEDNKAIMESLNWVLQYRGYLIATASNGKEAFELLNQGNHPTLILLDIKMPIMSGLEFRAKQQLNPHLKDIPTVLLTANGDLENVTLFPNEVVLTKPFDDNNLFDIITKFYTTAP